MNKFLFLLLFSLSLGCSEIYHIKYKNWEVTNIYYTGTDTTFTYSYYEGLHVDILKNKKCKNIDTKNEKEIKYWINKAYANY